MSARHLILDGYNLIHRANGGFQKGEWPIVFNFFRGLRPLIEKFLPVETVTVVLEGQPKRHEKLLASYKGNRASTPPSFKTQKEAILEILGSLPISTIRHADYEADDVIHNLISRLNLEKTDSSVTLVSSDSDFTQLLQRDLREKPLTDSSRISIWNWRNDVTLVRPDFDYVLWKALRGDPTDNIPKCKGMSEKVSLEVANDKSRLSELLKDESFLNDFKRNKELIAFTDFDDDTWNSCETVKGSPDWNAVKEKFISYSFKSMTKDGTWEKWVKTFSNIGKNEKL